MRVTATIVSRPLAPVSGGNFIGVYLPQVKHVGLLLCEGPRCFLCDKHQDHSVECSAEDSESVVLSSWFSFQGGLVRYRTHTGMANIAEPWSTLYLNVTGTLASWNTRYSVLDTNCFSFAEDLLEMVLGIRERDGTGRLFQALDINFNKSELESRAFFLTNFSLDSQTVSVFFKVVEMHGKKQASVLLWVDPSFNFYRFLLGLASRTGVDSKRVNFLLQKRRGDLAKKLDRTVFAIASDAKFLAEIDSFVTSLHKNFTQSILGDLYDISQVFIESSREETNVDAALFVGLLLCVCGEVAKKISWIIHLFPRVVVDWVASDRGLSNDQVVYVYGLLSSVARPRHAIETFQEIGNRVFTVIGLLCGRRSFLFEVLFGSFVLFPIILFGTTQRKGFLGYLRAPLLSFCFSGLLLTVFLRSYMFPVANFVILLLFAQLGSGIALLLVFLSIPIAIPHLLYHFDRLHFDALSNVSKVLEEILRIFGSPKREWMSMMDLEWHWDEVVSEQFAFHRWLVAWRVLIWTLSVVLFLYLLWKLIREDATEKWFPTDFVLTTWKHILPTLFSFHDWDKPAELIANLLIRSWFLVQFPAWISAMLVVVYFCFVCLKQVDQIEKHERIVKQKRSHNKIQNQKEPKLSSWGILAALGLLALFALVISTLPSFFSRFVDPLVIFCVLFALILSVFVFILWEGKEKI